MNKKIENFRKEQLDAKESEKLTGGFLDRNYLRRYRGRRLPPKKK